MILFGKFKRFISNRTSKTWSEQENKSQPKKLAEISPVTGASEAAIDINPFTDLNCSI